MGGRGHGHLMVFNLPSAAITNLIGAVAPWIWNRVGVTKEHSYLDEQF